MKTTLVKDYTDIPAFDKCFNKFFGHISDIKGKENDELSSLLDDIKQAKDGPQLTDKDLAELEELIEGAMDDIPEEFLFEKDSEELLKIILDDMEIDGSSGGMGMMLFQTKRSMMQMGKGSDQEGEGETENDPLLELLMGMVNRKSNQQKIGKEIKNRENYLLNKFIYQLTPDEIKEMREIVKRFGQKLKNRISLRKKRVKHGRIDIKRTFRSSLEYGGVPFKIFYKDRKIDRPQLVVLCDVSSSVNQYTRFMLLLTHTLQGLFSKVRTFAFIGNMVEITELFREMDPERAINSIFTDTDFTYGWGSNYGRSFDQFMENYSDSLNKKTTILILGDARNNNQDPGLNSFIRMKDKARNTFWLNPEKIHLWDWSDSIASVYKQNCTEMKEVNNFLDLSEFIDKLF